MFDDGLAGKREILFGAIGLHTLADTGCRDHGPAS